MPVDLYLLLVKGGEGETVPLCPGNDKSLGAFRKKPPNDPKFEFRLHPDTDSTDSLHRSAREAGDRAYEILKENRYLDCAPTIRYTLDTSNVDQRSADLLFALSVVVAWMQATQRPINFPAIAATGEIDFDSKTGKDKNQIKSVTGLVAKLKKAIETLPKDSIIFYPAFDKLAEDQGVSGLNDEEGKNQGKGKTELEKLQELHDEALKKRINLQPVKRLEEAIMLLGIKLDTMTIEQPYKGLSSFDVDDDYLFFGREHETELLYNWFANADGKPKTRLIVGASGSGKSSLARAGLIAKFIKPPTTFCYCIWELDRVLPASDDKINGEQRLIAAIKPSSGIDTTNITTFKALTAKFTEIHASSKGKFLLLIDPLEALFLRSYSDKTIQQFCQFLNEIKGKGIWIIATLRNDFTPQYQANTSLHKVFEESQYDLMAMESAAFDEVITAPAVLAGGGFENKGLSDKLRNAIHKQPDALPLLEFTLAQLWEQRKKPENLMTHKAYEDMGRLIGSIGKCADKVCKELSLDDKQSTLSVVLWNLAVVDQRKSDSSNITIAAQPVPLSRFPEETDEWKLIKAFTGARILIKDNIKGNPTVRVAHSALLTYWKTANDLIEKFKHDLPLRDRLLSESKRWKESNKKATLLIGDEGELRNARDMLLRRKEYHNSEDGENSLVFEFVDKSALNIERIQRSERNSKRMKRGFIALLGLVVFSVPPIILYLQVQNKHKEEITSLAKEVISEIESIGSVGLPRLPKSETLRKFVLKRSIEIIDKFSKRIPTDQWMIHQKKNLESQLMRLSNELANTPEVLSTLEKNITEYEALLKKNPNDLYLQFELAKQSIELAGLLVRLSNPENAEEPLSKAIFYIDVLIKNTTDDPDILLLQGRYFFTLGILKDNQNKKNEAIESLKQAKHLAEKSSSVKPDDLSAKHILALIMHDLSILYLDQKNLNEAAILLQQASSITKELAKDAIFHQASLVLYAKIYQTLGDLERLKDNRMQAHEYYLLGLKYIEPLAFEHPDVFDYHYGLALYFLKLGNTKDDAEKESFYLKAHKKFGELAIKHNENLELKASLANCNSVLGEFYSTTKQYSKAKELFDTALELYKFLDDAKTGNPSYQYSQVKIYNALGLNYIELDELATAKLSLEKGRLICKKIVDDYPSAINYKEMLGTIYSNQGFLNAKKGNIKDAISSYEEAKNIFALLKKDFPAYTEYDKLVEQLDTYILSLNRH